MKTHYLLTFFFISCTLVYSQGNVINVPNDYATIQEAIDASQNGDTVLVADGIYYENINFNDKAITLASHFLSDGDKKHIDNTVIDGSQSDNPEVGTVVQLVSKEDTTSVIYGFTITGGNGEVDPYGYGTRGGGGIIIGSGGKVQFNKITGNIVTNTSAAEGGGIIVDQNKNNVLILDNYITDNAVITTVWNDNGGGGIFVYKSRNYNVTIANNVISNNVVKSTSGSLQGNGGGVLLDESRVLLKNNLIKNNKAYYGGGVKYVEFLGSTEILFLNNTVVNNEAVKGGGYCGADTEKLPKIYNSIFWGNTATTSPQFYYAPIIRYTNVQGGREGAGNIDQDPMFADTVDFSLDLSSPCVDAGAPYLLCSDLEDPINPDVPLSPALGNLRNDMGAYGGNYKSFSSKMDRIVHVPKIVSKIQNAIEASQDGDTVLVADGTYYENIDFVGKGITLASHFLVDGDKSHIDNTTIDGSQPTNPNRGTVVKIRSGEDTTSVLYGFTVTGGKGEPDPYGYGTRGAGGIGINYSGAKIQYNKISGNVVINNGNAEGGGIIVNANSNDVLILDNFITNNEVLTSGSNGNGGGGIFLYKSLKNVIITNNVIANNRVARTDGNPTGNGGGIFLSESKAIIRNNLIAKNEAVFGGGLLVADSPTEKASVLVNNTIVGNEAFKGGGFYGEYEGEVPVFYNSILWGNTATSGAQIYYPADVRFSNVQGGYEGLENIDEEPMFADTLNYNLDPSSPCVDKGCPVNCFEDIPDPLNNDQPLFPSLGSMTNDMGWTGGDPKSKIPDSMLVPITSVNLKSSSIPQRFDLAQNYPNPFNPTTTITYSLPRSEARGQKSGLVELIVYDLLGRKVETLVNRTQAPGYYEVTWDATKYPSGVYFYTLINGDFKQTKKMMLLK